jgi:Arc/MetJ family transcription regulator
MFKKPVWTASPKGPSKQRGQPRFSDVLSGCGVYRIATSASPNHAFERTRLGPGPFFACVGAACLFNLLPLSLSRLTRMHDSGMLMHMRTTLNIDDSLLRDAAKLTGVKEKTSLVRLGLEALIAKESARRLANLGGTEKRLRKIPRRRPRHVA